jgi:hypothetical protein
MKKITSAFLAITSLLSMLIPATTFAANDIERFDVVVTSTAEI